MDEMKHAVAVLIALIMLAPLPVVAQNRAACPSVSPKVVTSKQISLAESPKITHPYITADVDIGSDGRVRDIRIIESSGDTVTDALARDGIKTWTFAPAQEACVASSSVVRTGLRLRDDAPEQHEIVPPPASDTCLPLVDAYITPNARDLAKRGTAHVDVPLDAAGALAGAPKITKSSGSATLDAEALRIAQSANYGFEPGTGCRPQSLVYSLELTFE